MQRRSAATPSPIAARLGHGWTTGCPLVGILLLHVPIIQVVQSHVFCQRHRLLSCRAVRRRRRWPQHANVALQACIPRAPKREHPALRALLVPRPEVKFLSNIIHFEGESMIPIDVHIVHVLEPLHGYLMQRLQPRDLPRRLIDHLPLDPERCLLARTSPLDERREDVLPDNAHLGPALLVDPPVRDEVGRGVDGALEAGLGGLLGIAPWTGRRIRVGSLTLTERVRGRLLLMLADNRVG
mmetsp:Transcript_55158/g.117216  ORF Transcript_55158/g.117216 Transcript_55158/m.117216 type:complete len:240 (+) Transcript_55158:161-880(+)